MPSAKSVWGIDVGQCALKALKLQWRDGKLRAQSFDVIEHAKILSQPDADEQALIRSALGKFLSRNSIKGSTVVISVPGQASFTRFIKLPPVEPKKIPEIVRYEARQQIPFNLEDVVWDYQAISPPAAGPREVEVGIFAMKRDIVNDYVSDFLAMRIEPDVVQMAPVALYNFLRYDKKDGGGATLLIDVGAENTNLVIADGERVWIRNVPLGGNNFTQALAKEFKLPFSKAESLKRHAAESKHARQVFQAMRPVFGDLLTEVQRSIGYYTSLHRDSRIERVVGLGNAFRLAGLAKFISQNLGVDVQKVEGFSTLGETEALSAPLFRENVLSFGVAFGLAVQGLGVGSISTSLLPPEILSQKVLKRKRPFFIAAGVSLLAAVACFGYDQVKTNGELSGKGNDIPRLEKAVAAIESENSSQQAAFDKQRVALEEEQRKIDDLQALVANDAYVYDLMKSLWAVWPVDPRWADYQKTNYKDVKTAEAVRANLDLIEMVNITIHYVPDVRAYSEQSGATEVINEGGEGSAAAAGGKAAEPGVLIRIHGITPKTGRDASEFVERTLIDFMKKDPRTVHLKTTSGEEILARMKLTGMFRANAEYSNFQRPAATAPVAPVKGGPVLPPPPPPRAQAVVDKGGDFWFEAQWVVKVPDAVKTDATSAPKSEAAASETAKPAS
jgi:type IV pilus assembly protein PilM